MSAKLPSVFNKTIEESAAWLADLMALAKQIRALWPDAG